MIVAYISSDRNRTEIVPEQLAYMSADVFFELTPNSSPDLSPDVFGRGRNLVKIRRYIWAKFRATNWISIIGCENAQQVDLLVLARSIHRILYCASWVRRVGDWRSWGGSVCGSDK